MGKVLKYFLLGLIGLMLVIVFLPVAILLAIGYGTFRLIKYLLKEKGKYKDTKDCFKDIKNVGALIAIVLGIVIVPTGLVKYTMFCIEGGAQVEAQKVIEKEKSEIEAEKKAYERERTKLLTPSKRISGDIETIDDRCILTKEDIEKYSITDEEVSKFEEDKKVAIQNYKDKKTIKKFEKMAEQYMSKNTTSTMGRSYFTEKADGYGYNKDKTTVTIYGRYEGRNIHGIEVRNRYKVTFDAKTEKVIEADLGKELVGKPKEKK